MSTGLSAEADTARAFGSRGASISSICGTPPIRWIRAARTALAYEPRPASAGAAILLRNASDANTLRKPSSGITTAADASGNKGDAMKGKVLVIALIGMLAL